MPPSSPFLRVQYFGLRATAELKAQVEAASANLQGFQQKLEECELSVGRWFMHHGTGYVYRVGLEILLPGLDAPIVTTVESAPNAAPDTIERVLHETFEIAALRLSALLNPTTYRASPLS